MKNTNATMLPFGGPRYSENSDRCPSSHEACCYCGKAVKVPGGYVEVLDGGGAFLMKDAPPADTADGGHMGLFAVGPDCAKRLAKAGVKVTPI